ncbi:MAG: hypothetical protein NWR87_03025 [Rhodospirillales bacterium]|nr:hypothetical protein [Rhodospirillales bacterium]
MTSSRADLYAGLVAAICIAMPAAAQTPANSGPVDLTRPPGLQGPGNSAAPESQSQTDNRSTAPMRLIPAVRSTPETPSDATPKLPSNSLGKAGIEVDGLSKIDDESVGILSEQDGGFGINMWRGITRADAVALVNGLPKHLESAALRDVASRLLLSRAKAPVAVGENAKSLLAARSSALLAMGNVESTDLLMTASPSQDRPIGLDEVDAKLQVLKYNNAHACGLVRNNRATINDDFWQRLVIYCDALDGNADRVGFGLSLLRETSGDDPALVLLADAVITRNKIILEKIDRPTPIHLALSRTAKVELPLSVAESKDPLVLYSAAMAPNLKIGARIEAAERAVPMGALNPAELRQLYQQVTYTDADIGNALARAAEVGGAAARALLYQAALKQNIPSARAEIISTALGIAREDGRYIAAVKAFRPLINRLPPSPELVWFALTGVRAFLTLGDPVGTDRWMALLRASATVIDDSKLALARVRPLARLIGAGDKSIPLEAELTEWHKSLGDRPEAPALRTALNGMLLALGEDVPPSAWAGIPSGTATSQMMPAPDVWFKFRESMRALGIPQMTQPMQTFAGGSVSVASENSQIEKQVPIGAVKAAIYALQVMGDGGPGARGISVVYEVVAAFKAMGFEQNARQLALETLLAAGL